MSYRNVFLPEIAMADLIIQQNMGSESLLSTQHHTRQMSYRYKVDMGRKHLLVKFKCSSEY